MFFTCWYFNINYIQSVRQLLLRWWLVIGTDYSLSFNQHWWRSHCVTGVSVKRPNDRSSINNQNIVWADSGLMECVVIYFKLKSCFPEVETLISFSATFLFSFPVAVWLLEPAVSCDHHRCPFLSALFGSFHLMLGFACWMRTVYKSHEESINQCRVFKHLPISSHTDIFFLFLVMKHINSPLLFTDYRKEKPLLKHQMTVEYSMLVMIDSWWLFCDFVLCDKKGTSE